VAEGKAWNYRSATLLNCSARMPQKPNFPQPPPPPAPSTQLQVEVSFEAETHDGSIGLQRSRYSKDSIEEYGNNKTDICGGEA